MAKQDAKTCFVISPIGGDESQTRKWADQTIKHLIGPAAEKHGFVVMRADQEDRAGIITTHIIQRLVGSELVIADLTGRNPNVFYELAVRHVTRKPLVQIIRAEEDIPFDVQGMRTVKFELNDPDILEQARDALERQVAAVLEEGEMETPISQAVGQQLALESGDPRQVELAELSKSVQALTAEVRASSASRSQTVYERVPLTTGTLQSKFVNWRTADVGAEPFAYYTVHGKLDPPDEPEDGKSSGSKRKSGASRKKGS